jgi:hypothetical protein
LFPKDALFPNLF